MKRRFIRLDTILLPENKSRKQILRLANQMPSKDNETCIVDKRYVVHLTIYAPEYPSRNLPMILKTIREVGSTCEKIRLRFTGIYVADRSVCLAFKKSAEIIGIHQLILKRLNPLRENRIEGKYVDGIEISKYSMKEAAYIKKFGRPNVLDEWRPHVTLGRYNNDKAALDAKKKISELGMFSEVLFPYIAVSEMGPNSTCVKILEKIGLH